MIDFVKGIPVHIDTDYIVLDVNGIGYRIFVSNPYIYHEQESEPTMVYTHYHVREDAALLYGFSSREEQALFRRLLDVSGIGPRVAISILAGGKPQDIVSAITQENVTYLTKLPGIGKKTAQRMVLDLKDKLAGLDFGQGDARAIAAQELQSYEANESTSWLETKEGLLALGYTEAEIEKVKSVVLSKLQTADSADQMLKAALQALYQG